jgi:hypothetical protein
MKVDRLSALLGLLLSFAALALCEPLKGCNFRPLPPFQFRVSCLNFELGAQCPPDDDIYELPTLAMWRAIRHLNPNLWAYHLQPIMCNKRGYCLHVWLELTWRYSIGDIAQMLWMIVARNCTYVIISTPMSNHRSSSHCILGLAERYISMTGLPKTFRGR